MLDAVILIIIGFILSVIIEIVAPFIDPFFDLFAFIIITLFYVGFWTWRGQTPGKMIVGIKIVRCDSSSINIGRAFLRVLGYLVSAFILYIGFIMIAGDGKKQGLHDKIADTIVIKVR
jgi:uncharacterized RDD family membrane protein YckC